MDDLKRRFQEAVPQLQELINKRRGSWRLTSVMEWEDVSSILLTRIWKQFGRYDVNRPLDRWANTVITHTITSLLRDNLYRWARPCIAADSYGNACAFNTGGNSCAWTKNRVQCSECPMYKRWENKKQAKFAVATPLSLEDHLDTSNNRPVDFGDFVDYGNAKSIIDTKIMLYLNRTERKLYRLLYIKGLEPEEAGRRMGYKLQRNSKIPGYLTQKKLVEKFVLLSRTIIETENLA